MHVELDLSAYLDGELPPGDRARVEGHLAACPVCARRLAELRATVSLIRALPSIRPSRRLAARVTSVAPPGGERTWNWLRPMRSLSALASGAFLFMFLVTAVVQAGSGLGGGAVPPWFGATGPAAAPAAAPSPAADQAQREAAPTAVAAPRAAETDRQAYGAAGPATASPSPAEDAAKVATASPAALASEVERSPQAGARLTDERSERVPLAQPILWLALAIVAAASALAAHWRLRAS